MLKLLTIAFSQGNLHQVNQLLMQGNPSFYTQLAFFTALCAVAYLYPKTQRLLKKMQWREFSLLPVLYLGGCILVLLGWGNALVYIYYLGMKDVGGDLLHSYFGM